MDVILLYVVAVIFGLSAIGCAYALYKNHDFCRDIEDYLIFVLLIVCIVVSIVFYCGARDEKHLREHGYNVYTLKLYYLGGSTEVRNFTISSSNKPYIWSSRGSYYLRVEYMNVEGVVRFEIISQKSIPYSDEARKRVNQ